MAGFVDGDGSAVGQYDVELAEVVADQAVYTLEGSMATPQTGAKHADAIASTSGGNIALILKVCCCLTVVDTASEPGGLPLGWMVMFLKGAMLI